MLTNQTSENACGNPWFGEHEKRTISESIYDHFCLFDEVGADFCGSVSTKTADFKPNKDDSPDCTNKYKWHQSGRAVVCKRNLLTSKVNIRRLDLFGKMIIISCSHIPYIDSKVF